MIDIHSHILHSLDDGPQTLSESVKLAAEAVSNGVRRIIATPHHKNGVYDNPKRQVIEKVHELQVELDRLQIPLTVYPGQEVRVYSSIIGDLQNQELLCLDERNKYLLLELPHDHVPPFIDQILYEIQLLGMTPVIPHPERNIAIRKRPNLLYQMIKKGALSQITAASVVGKFGRDVQKFTFRCVEHNLCHLIASDAHRAGKRGFYMQEAYERLIKEFSYPVVQQLQANADMVMSGSDMYVTPPQKMEKKRFFTQLLKRS